MLLGPSEAGGIAPDLVRPLEPHPVTAGGITLERLAIPVLFRCVLSRTVWQRHDPRIGDPAAGIDVKADHRSGIAQRHDLAAADDHRGYAAEPLVVAPQHPPAQILQPADAGAGKVAWIKCDRLRDDRRDAAL
jgi:hypothetical protein